MKELSDTDYAKLVKNADDNNTIHSIARMLFTIIIILFLYFAVGQRFVDSWFDSYNESVRCDIETMRAKNSVLIREIQSEGMTTEEYLEWYKIYKQVD